MLQLMCFSAMFAEVIVPCKKEKKTRYCSLQELGLVMCARTVGLYATGTADVFFGVR